MKVKNKDNFVSMNDLDKYMMATVTTTEFKKYDRQGRPVETHAEWSKDDYMNTRGTTDETASKDETVLPYDELGQKKYFDSSSITRVSRGLDDDGRDGYDLVPTLGNAITKNWAPFLSSWSGAFTSLSNIGNPFNLVDDPGTSRDAVRTTNTSETAQNNYVYDLYGNMDAEATRDRSSRQVTSWDEGADDQTPLAKTLNIVIQVYAIVATVILSVLTAGAATAAMVALYAAIAAASAAMSSLASSAVNGVKFGKALGLAAIQAVAAAASTYFGGGQGFTNALISTAVNMAASVGSAAIMGARGDDLWRTALAGAVAGLAGPISNGLGGGIVARVLVAAALNIAAARIEGVKNGNQLLLIGALAGATAAVSYYAGNKPADNNGTQANPRTSTLTKAIIKAITGAIVGYALGLVIANSIRGPTGQAVASFVAMAVTATFTGQDTVELSTKDKKTGEILKKQVTLNFLSKGLGDSLFKGMEQQNASKREEKPVTLRYGPGEKNVETQLKDISRQRSKEERAKNAVTQQLFSSAKFFAGQIQTLKSIGAELLQGKNPFAQIRNQDANTIETNVQALTNVDLKQGTDLRYIDLNNSESPISLIMNSLLGSSSNGGLLGLVIENPFETSLSIDILEVDLDNTSYQANPETMTAKPISFVNSTDMSPLSLFSARDSVNTNQDSSSASRGKMKLDSDIDVSKMQIRLDSRESNFTTIKTTERKPVESVLSKEQIESVFATVKGVKLDNAVLKDFKTQIAQLQKQGLIDAGATLIGVRINGLAAVVAVKDNRIVGALFGNAAGQNEFRSFTKIQFNEKGQVMKAEGKIHREIGGQFEVRGSFVYAAKGSQEYQMAMTRAENLVQSAEALAVIKQADAVYTEKNNEGNVTRQVYIGKDEQGGARVLASEHLMTDGSMRMLTYDYALTGQEKSEGVLAKGKIYESKGFNEKYGAAAIGEFKIQKVGANVVMTASIGMAIVAQLGIGGHERIVYEETTTKGKREISLNAATGGLEYVYEKGPDGSGRVVVFGDKAPVAPGVQVVKFSDLQANEQDQVLASLPAMDSRDPALITQQLVKMSEALNAAVAIKKLGEALGMEVKDVFLQLPEGMAAELGLPKGTILNVTNMRMDENNEVILEGTLTSKDLKAEKNFILVASASTIAAALGQKNDTKGAQLLLIQEKGGYRAVTYVPDANAKGNVRVLNNVDVVTPETVHAALKETKNMGGFGKGTGILDRIERASAELKREWVNRGGRAAADRMEKTMGEMSKLDDRLGAMTIEGLQLGKHEKILGVLLKTAGLDNQSTLAAVEAMTRVDGLSEMGATLDQLSQKMGDIKTKLTTVEDLGTLKSLWAEVGTLKKEMASIEKGMKAGELAIDGKLEMAVQLETILKDMIKNPLNAPQRNNQLFDVLKSYKGTPVLPTPTFLRLKAGLVESAPTQLARMGNELEREQLALEMESLLAIRKDVAGLKEGAVKGDFIEDPTGYQILGQVLAGLTPAGLAADGRDVIANAGKVVKTGGRENKLMLAMAALGFVPLVGDGATAILKQTLAKGVGENIDEAAEIVLKTVSETAPQFKDGDEALAALRAGGVELAGVKATLKGSMVVLEMSGKEAKALANDSGRIKALVAIAESKGIGRLSLKITGPEAKETIKNIKLFNTLSAEGLEPIRVASEKAKLTAKANYEEAKGAWTTAKGESRRLVNEAETALKASDGELALAKAQKAEFEELVTRWQSKEVSDSEFIRKAEGYIEGARPAGDRAGSPGQLLGSDRLQQGGGSHLEGSGRPPSQGSGSVGQSDSPLGREPSGTGSNVERAERIAERGRAETAAGRAETAAGRAETAAGEFLDRKVQIASAKNRQLKQNLADLRNGKADSLSGAKEAGLGARRARAENELRRGELNFVEQRIKVVSSNQVQDVVKVDIGLESVSPDDIDTAKLFDALRGETAQSGIPVKRWGGLDPGMSVGGAQTPLAGKVPSTTAEAGSQAGTILVYSARTSEGVAESFAQGARRDIMGKSAFTTRHGPGEYVAEQSATAVAEVMGKVGGKAPEAVNVKVLDLASAKVLDYTDPAVAKKMGVEDLLTNSNRNIAYEPLQEAALKARAMGYDVIKFPSAKDGTVNYLVTDNFKDLLKVPSDWTNKGIVGIDRTTIKEAERILKNSEPTTAGMAKTVVMGLGGGLLLGAGARSARAGMANNETPTAVERSGKTMGTLGLGTVVDRLSKVDIGPAIEKTQKVLSGILDVGQTAAQSVGSWGTNLVNDVGTILQTQGENMTTRDAPPQTSPRSPTISAPDTTPLPTLTITPQKGTEYTNSLAVETLSSLLGPMPSTPSEVVTAGWDALPIPFKPQVIQVASAMGFNAYGEGRDYSVVGGEDFGDRFSALVAVGQNPETGATLFRVKPGETFNDGQKEWQAGSLFEKTEKEISLVRGFATEASIERLNWGGKALTVIYKGSEKGPQVIGVDLSGLKAGTKVEVTGTIHLPINKLSMLSGSFTMGDGGKIESLGHGTIYMAEGSVGWKFHHQPAENRMGQLWDVKVDGNSVSIENPVYKMADGKEITISTVMTGTIEGGKTEFKTQKINEAALSLWGPVGEKAVGGSVAGLPGNVTVDKNGAVVFHRVKFDGQADVAGPFGGGSANANAAPLNKDLAFLRNVVTVKSYDAKTNRATIVGEFMVHTDAAAGDVAVGFGIGTRFDMAEGVRLRDNGVEYFQNGNKSLSEITPDRGFVPGFGVAGKVVGRQETLIFGEKGAPWIRVERELDQKTGVIFERATMAASGEALHSSVDSKTGIMRIDAVGKEKAQLLLSADQRGDKTGVWHGILTSGEGSVVGALFKIAEKSPINILGLSQQDVITGRAVVKKTYAVVTRNVVAVFGTGEMMGALAYAKVTGDFKPINDRINKWEGMDSYITQADKWIDSSKALMGEQKAALVRAAEAGVSLKDVEYQSFKMAAANIVGGLGSGGMEETRASLNEHGGGVNFVLEQPGQALMLFAPHLGYESNVRELSGGDWRREGAAGRVAFGESVATTAVAAFLAYGTVKGFQGGYGKVGTIREVGGKFTFKLNPLSERIMQGTKGASLEVFDVMSPVGHDLLDVNKVLVPMGKKAHFELSGAGRDLKEAGFSYKDADRVAYNRDTNTFVFDLDAGVKPEQVVRVIESNHNVEVGATNPKVVENALADSAMTPHLTEDSVRTFKGQVDNVIQQKNQLIDENIGLRKEARQEATINKEQRFEVEQERKGYGTEQERLRALKNQFEKGKVSPNDVEGQIGEIVSGKHPSRQQSGSGDRSGIVEGTGQGRQGTGESGQRDRQNNQNVEKGNLQNRETPETNQRGSAPKSDLAGRIEQKYRTSEATERTSEAIRRALQEVEGKIRSADTRIEKFRERENTALGRADEYRGRIDEARTDVRALKKVGEILEKRIKQGEPQGPVRLAVYLEDDNVAANLLIKYGKNLDSKPINRSSSEGNSLAESFTRLVANERGQIAVPTMGGKSVGAAARRSLADPATTKSQYVHPDGTVVPATQDPTPNQSRGPPTFGDTMPDGHGFKNGRPLKTSEVTLDYGPKRPNQFLKEQTPNTNQAHLPMPKPANFESFGIRDAKTGQSMTWERLNESLTTKPNEAFFWSGSNGDVRSEFVAPGIANYKKGKTLETLLDEKKIKLPKWDPTNPTVVDAWKSVSRIYAENASGVVHTVLGDKVSGRSVWEVVEKNALINNKKVTKIISIDPVTRTEKVIFER